MDGGDLVCPDEHVGSTYLGERILTTQMRALMAIISEDMYPNGPGMMMFGPGASGNAGDYVMTQRESILSRRCLCAVGAGRLHSKRALTTFWNV